jgi:hypothetical protein
MTRPVMILVGKQLLAAGLHEMTAWVPHDKHTK